MLFIVLISTSVLIWNIGAQRSQDSFGFGLYSSNLDFLRNKIQGGVSDTFGDPDNAFSRAYPKNTMQSGIDNGFGANSRVENNQQKVLDGPTYNSGKVQSLQGIYSVNVEPQSQISQQKSVSQQQSYQQTSQFQRNSYQQKEQSQQPTRQQTAQPQQQSYQQNTQTQQQLYEQNVQPQEELYQQDVQPQQQLYQQNVQGRQQLYQQNTQAQQQLYQQKVKPQQQPYNDADYYSKNRNTQTTTDKVFSTKFGDESTRTGKPKQNSHYNNATFAITRFGLKLFKTMSRDYQNIVASPYSVAMLLALVQQGAHGETQQEITQLLQLTPESSASLFKGLTDFMKKRHSLNVLNVASNVVLSNKFNIDSKFKSAALNSFGSDVTRMNFNNPYDATKKINEWVAGKTGQKIKNLLAPDAVQQDTLAMLINAVYFKGVWQKKFNPEMTTQKEFTLSDGTKTVASFMQARRMFQTDIDPVIKSQILLLPFDGTQYSMMFILPLKGVYAVDVLSSLTEPQLYAYHKLPTKEVKVEIPRFNIKKDSDMYFLLNLLGLWKIFSTEADLTGIGKQEGASPYVTSGVHSAALSIDEQGGTAAAATAFSVVALSYDDPTTSFTADRPFLAILWDNELSMPLFMAKIEDPTE